MYIHIKMPIELQELEKPKMKIVEMTCDKPIDEKLLKYPAVAECLAHTHTTAILGLMGAGKTTTALSIITSIYPKCFSDIYVVMPEQSMMSIPDKHNIFKKWLNPEEHLYHDLTEEVLDTIIGKVQENSMDGNRSLVLVDDFGEKYRDKEIEQRLNHLIIKMRHYKTCVLLLGQSIKQLPAKMRSVSGNLILFNLGKMQMEQVFKEMMQIKRQDFDDLMELYKEPHDWLMVNVKKRKIFYKLEKEVKITK